MTTYTPTMRMGREHFNRLAALITPLDTPALRHRYATGEFPNADRCRDLAMRYRWDLVWLAPTSERNPLFSDMYADNLTDNHIDTALKRIVPTLHPEN